MKLQFKSTKSHRNHYDDWNVLKDGEVGEYPDDVGKEKLIDFPLNFSEFKPKEVKPTREKPDEVKQDESVAEKAPDKSMKSKRTKIKRW